MVEEFENEKISEVTKILIAFVCVMVVGGIIIATSGVTEEQKASNAVLMQYSNLSRIAQYQCPRVILKHTGEKPYVVKNSDSDKQSYVTLTYKGDNEFSESICTVGRLGKVAKLLVDGKKII
jgi:hypothetical protein